MDENKDYVSCYYCGKESLKEDISKKQKALCPRCKSVVYESHSIKNFNYAFIFAITSLILFIPAQIYPIFTFELNSIPYTTTFFDSALTLFYEGYGLLSLVIILTAIVFPLVLLFSIISIVLYNNQKIKIINEKELYKLYTFVKTYSFMEVFLIALVVAYVKLVDISSVEIHNSIYYFIACVAFYILARTNLNITRVHLLDQDFPNSFNFTFALVITGIILYIPANFLPMMNISKFGNVQPDTIMSGVMELMRNDMEIIGIIVFFASIVIPLFKLVGMFFILLTIKFDFFKHKILLLRLYKFIEVIGKWSVLDIYMIAILVALVREESIAFVEPGDASIYFTLVIFITIFATETFDTKLIWKK